ncbi:MAG: ATPase domain-containing protein [Methanomassiliicoccales archaeon]|jgi:KaiC/GvpD/RAD55 family RecA-like ATPase|nr:signal transduction protein [Methanomassiliicoccales archaeon]MDH7508973.1 ATPase domain-containing protein [Methanomassiliicoccales archaeon]
MFKNSIQGLEKVFRTDIESPKVVLVTGPPGSLKTSFTYSLISTYLEKTGEYGLYVTLEESAESHVKNMRSLGIKIASNLEISDFTDLRELDEIIESEAPTDYLHFVEQVIGYFKKKHQDKFTVFALDSLGALYSLMDDMRGMRKKMFYFFKTLRDFNLISFIIMERSQGGSVDFVGNEVFLADGIIELGLDRTRGKLVRFIRVEKMRACEHSMEKHTIEIGSNGLMVLGPTLA